ncbi:MAG: protein kinase [Planctomycetes bacterium]|nr:protein kinase [Planctomycetota bacterium]
MHPNEQLDDLFLERAERRGLLAVAQINALRDELDSRRGHEPDLCAHELVVEKGWLGVEAALAVLEAHPDETLDELKARLLRHDDELQPIRRDTERLARLAPYAGRDDELAPEQEDFFPEVPKFVEPVGPAYAFADAGDTDSNLEMELPPPDTRSGDSLFEEQQQNLIPSLEADDEEPAMVERTPSARLAQVKLDALDNVDLEEEDVLEAIDSLDAEEAGRFGPESSSATSLGIDKEDTSLGITGLRVGDTAQRTASDTAHGEDEVSAPAPQFQLKGSKGASVDFSSFGDDDTLSPDALSTFVEDESEEISQLMNDSAVNEVMEQADDTYFGPPADLTTTPQEMLHDSIAPPKPVDAHTLFDSEDLKPARGRAAASVSHREEDFAATAPPENPEMAQARIDEDSDVSVTVQDDFPTGGGTIIDDSDVSMEDITSESEVTTGSRTQFQTGEGGRRGLRDRTDSKLGSESAVTGEKITGHEMTLADLRAQMGIGSGVKVGKHTTRLKKLAGSKRRYSVIREIARGGMGKVIEVEDNDLRRSVALKVLRKEMLDRRDLVERFLEEAQITGQLEHPNIVPVHEIGVDGRGNLYFTMKLVEGEDLSSILKRLRKKDPSAEKAFPITRLVDIYIKICEGVAFAHSKGVIHRDLKPANVMVGRFGEVQIMDWGVAKIVGRKEDTADRAVVSDRQDDDASRTMTGSILGTPSYMSPEQARGEVNTMGPESDIFSLGVILYELLALQTPWTAQTSAQVLDQVKNFDPQSPSAMNPDRKIPVELEQLAMKCIAKQSHKRIGTAAELIDNLKSWQEGRTLAAVKYSLGQLIGKWVTRHKVAVITSLLVLAALVGGSIFAYQAAQRAGTQRAENAIAEADLLLGSARESLGKSDFADARKLAGDAASKYQSALITLGDDERASKGLAGANTVSSEATVREEIVRRESEDLLRQKQLQKEFNESLVIAVQALEQARKLDAAGEADLLKVNAAYDDARSAFVQVRSIRVEGLEEEKLQVANALAEIDAWLKGYETRKQSEVDMAKLRTLVDSAGKKLATAKAAEKYETASRALIETISVCDQAIAVSAPGEPAERLRDRALNMKADAALTFAKRALTEQRFDVAELMLDTGASTGRLSDEIRVTRDALKTQVQEQSQFKQAMAAAEQAIADKDWAMAQTYIRSAMTEAKNSQFATENDRARLERMLQLAMLEQLHARDVLAARSEEMEAVLKDYDELTPQLTDADYRSRALTYREDLRRRLGSRLVEEAESAEEDAVRGELYEKALAYVTDKAVVADIKARLGEIKMRLALAQVAEGLVLLDRGTFILGSNRESDQNPQRQVEQAEYLFLDKHPVTNEEFKAFVDAGGYSTPEYWPEEARPMLSQFVDSTGASGPASWAEGGFDVSLAKYPVTGVSWYEASAYAAWKGKRLPTPEEWEIAAGAPVAGAVDVADYPWGLREKAPPMGVLEPREVGTAEWDSNPTGARDMGSNVAEWTSLAKGGAATVKGAEPGLRAELWFRYARRAKVSYSPLLDRSSGRGFRCIQTFTFEGKDGDGD